MPYEFFIDLLYPVPLRVKKMFGVNSYYIADKIVFALRKTDKLTEDNGIWIASKLEHHQKLKHKIKGLTTIKSYGIKSWLVRPEEFEYFEEEANKLAELIKKDSDLIGNVPKLKRKR